MDEEGRRFADAAVNAGAPRRMPPTAGLRRSRPRAYEEWKALRRWGRLPTWEPLRPGFILRATREEVGVTQAELALRLGVTQQAVGRAESATSNPTTALLEAWALALGADLRLEFVRGTAPAARP